MCVGCPLHASLILNTGSKFGQKEVLFFRTMQARQNSAYICTTAKHCNNKTLSCSSYCSQF